MDSLICYPYMLSIPIMIMEESNLHTRHHAQPSRQVAAARLSQPRAILCRQKRVVGPQRLRTLVVTQRGRDCNKSESQCSHRASALGGAPNLNPFPVVVVTSVPLTHTGCSVTLSLAPCWVSGVARCCARNRERKKVFSTDYFFHPLRRRETPGNGKR